MELDKSIKTRIIGLDLEDKIFICLLFFIGIFLLYLVSGFKHVPGPIYGGDLYMIRGFTQAILQGNSPWYDPYFAGYYAYYGWFAYLITAILVKITWIGLERMSTLLPAFVQIFFLVVSYKFGSTFFKSKRYGLIFMLATFSFMIINTKLSGAFANLFTLLTLWSWIEYENGNKKYKYLMGIFMGLTALSHIINFVGVSAIIGFTLFVEFFREFLKRDKKKVFFEFINKYLVVFVIALLVALPLVGPWIFVYHMNTLNPTPQYCVQDVDKAGVGWIFSIVLNLFIRTDGILSFIFGIVVLLGIIFCFLNRKRLEHRFIIYWLIALILAASHFLITKPFLNKWITPGLLWGNSIWVVNLILFTFGLKNIELILSKFSLDKKIIFAAFVVFLTAVSLQTINNFNNDRWVQYGRSLDPSTKILFDTEAWMLSNTDKDDVFLANDESAFALNALSGRKVVTVRRTHANVYVDVEKRYADAIVMLYGNDKTKTDELLKEYSVDYLYIDSSLITMPMIVSLDYEDYLKENGVNYTIENVRWDPSTEDVPSFMSLVVYPQELRILNYNITTPVKQFLYNGQTHSVFYKIIV